MSGARSGQDDSEVRARAERSVPRQQSARGRTIGLFPIPEFPEMRTPVRGDGKGIFMWMLTWLIGDGGFLLRLLRRVFLILKASIYPIEDQRNQLLKWLQATTTVQIQSLDQIWGSGWIVCAAIDGSLPGACTGHVCDQETLEHAQTLAAHYLGIEPEFTTEDFKGTLNIALEWRLVSYLTKVQEALSNLTPPLPKLVNPKSTLEGPAYTLDYVARGVGLQRAQTNKKVCFKIYPTAQQSLEPGEITVIIKGPVDISSTIIPPIQGKTQLYRQAYNLSKKTKYTGAAVPIVHGAGSFYRSYGNSDMKKMFYIPKQKQNVEIDVLIRKDHAKVSYMTKQDGEYEISLISRGGHLVGSSFKVTSTANIIDCDKSPDLDEDDECGILDVKADRKVIMRIVDFVSEKMVLKEDGKLEKISNDEAEELITKAIGGNGNLVIPFGSQPDLQVSKRFRRFVQHIIVMLRVCKHWSNIVKKSKSKITKIEPFVPDIVNSTFYYKDAESPGTLDRITITHRAFESNNPFNDDAVDGTVHQAFNIYGKNPFMIDEHAEENDAGIKFVIDRAESLEPYTNTNPFMKIDRPKTPVLKIINNEVDDRLDTVYINENGERSVSNEFFNPVYGLKDEAKLAEVSQKIDFIIGAPVSKPPKIISLSPENGNPESNISESLNEPLLHHPDKTLSHRNIGDPRALKYFSHATIDDPLAVANIVPMEDLCIDYHESNFSMGPAEKELWNSCNNLGAKNSATLYSTTNTSEQTSAQDSATVIVDGLNQNNQPEPDSLGQYKNYENFKAKDESLEVDFTKISDHKVDSASDVLADVKRHENVENRPISEVQKQFESGSVSWSQQENEESSTSPFKSFSERPASIVYEKKRYWDERIEYLKKKRSEEEELIKTISKKSFDLNSKPRGKNVVKTLIIPTEASFEVSKSKSKPKMKDKQSFEIQETEKRPHPKLVDRWRLYWDKKLETERLKSKQEQKSNTELVKSHLNENIQPHLCVQSTKEHDLSNRKQKILKTLEKKKEENRVVAKVLEIQEQNETLKKRNITNNNSITTPVEHKEVFPEKPLSSVPIKAENVECNQKSSNPEEKTQSQTFEFNVNESIDDRKNQNIKTNKQSSYSQDEPIIQTFDFRSGKPLCFGIENMRDKQENTYKPRTSENEENKNTATKTADKNMTKLKEFIKSSSIDDNNETTTSKQLSIEDPSRITSTKHESFVLSANENIKKEIESPEVEDDGVLQAFESSPKRFFGSTRNSIIERIDSITESDHDVDVFRGDIEYSSLVDLRKQVFTKSASEELPEKKNKKQVKRVMSDMLEKRISGGSYYQILEINNNIKNKKEPSEANLDCKTCTSELKEEGEDIPKIDIKKVITVFEKECSKEITRQRKKRILKDSLRSRKSSLQSEVELTSTNKQDSDKTSDHHDIKKPKTRSRILECKDSSHDSGMEDTPHNLSMEMIDFADSEEGKRRFKRAKTFFQSLSSLTEIKSKTLNECEMILLSNSVQDLKNRTKIQSLSAPTSDNENELWSISSDTNRKLVSISEKFHVDDLFNDVVGEGKLSRQGSFRGIPNKQAVLATFRSMENMADRNAPYELATDQLEDTSNPGKEDAQTFQSEYPYLPKTKPSKYRSRVDHRAFGLISRYELLKNENIPRRNSVPDLFKLNEKFSAAI